MSKAVGPKQKESTADQKLSKALGHPIRQRILQVINANEEASPSEIAVVIGESLNTLAYHIRVLKDCDAIELTRKEVSNTTVKHYYRARIRPIVDEDNWRSLPEKVRESLLDDTFQQIWSNVRAASESQALRDPRTAAAWDAVKLDDEGFAEASRLLEEFVRKIIALQGVAEGRLAALDPEERAAKSHLVEVDAMLYPIKEIPAPHKIERQPQSGSDSTDSKST